MKLYTRISTVALLLLLAVGSLQAKGKDDDKVYAFSYGTCFNDSTVFISAVEVLEGAVVDSKTKFLVDRSRYSNRMKAYLDTHYDGAHTCAVFFDKKRDSLEKLYAKLRRTIKKDTHTTLVEIPVTEFKLSASTEAEQP